MSQQLNCENKGGLSLQEQIEYFVQTWGPDVYKYRDLSDVFIAHLRNLMNNYARAALQHGNIPEVGGPHKERRCK